MLTRTNYTIPLTKIQEALTQIPNVDFRLAINEPIGNFFYDEWKLKDEFLGTVWEEIYNSLPLPKGEARIIKLSGGECYISHADVDDRYHLNLSGICSYLIDLDSNNMIKVHADGCWYNMNAAPRHTAANFGNVERYQLVVRHLLNRNHLTDPVAVDIVGTGNKDDARFAFDDAVSSWLNVANKQGKISNFKFINGVVSFDINKQYLSELESLISTQIKLIVK